MIDLCVVNYNTQPLLERLIKTLASDLHIMQPWLLYIADNGSTDGSAMYLTHVDGDYIPKIHINPNIGYAAACNALAAEGKGDIIGLLNADVWLTTKDIHLIQAAFDRDPEVAILGPKQRNEDGRIVHAGIFGPNTAPKHRGWMQHDPDDTLYRDKLEATTISGSAYFIRRSVWEEMTEHPGYRTLFPDAKGAFLPTPHYYEETWCSYFARHLGYKVWYGGNVSIGHTWRASTGPDSVLNHYFRVSKEIFNQSCDKLGIEHD